MEGPMGQQQWALSSIVKAGAQPWARGPQTAARLSVGGGKPPLPGAGSASRNKGPTAVPGSPDGTNSNFPSNCILSTMTLPTPLCHQLAEFCTFLAGSS